MSTLMDIIISTVLGGIIILITLNANMTLRQTWTSYNNQAMVQQMLISTAEILECDLRNMGCGVLVATQTITEARDTCISFLMAEGPEYGRPALPITYRTGDLQTGTDNPLDRWLIRNWKGADENIGLVTQFKLKYMDENGIEIPVPVSDINDRIRIRIIEITMEVQSPYVVILEYDPDKRERYASALWKQTRLASQNLSR